MSEINEKIKGRVALLSEDEGAALAKMTAISGDHVELGTLWGGTAILAALAKQRAGVDGHIYTVDFMKGGYWEHGDPSLPGQRPTEGAIYDNLARFGVESKVTVIKASSYPWPITRAVRPSTVLIDCGHTYDDCLRDWQSVRALLPRFVAFHDYNEKYPGVSAVVDEITAHDDRYKPFARAGTLMIFSLKPSPKAEPKPEPTPVMQLEPKPVKRTRRK